MPYQIYFDFYICGGKFGLISGDIFLLRSVRYARNCRFPKKGGFEGWMVMIRIMLTIFTVRLMLTVMTKGGFECWMMMVGVISRIMLTIFTVKMMLTVTTKVGYASSG